MLFYEPPTRQIMQIVTHHDAQLNPAALHFYARWTFHTHWSARTGVERQNLGEVKGESWGRLNYDIYKRQNAVSGRILCWQLDCAVPSFIRSSPETMDRCFQDPGRARQIAYHKLSMIASSLWLY